MRTLMALIFAMSALPAVAQSNPCKGRTVIDVGHGGKACIYLIDESDFTWTRTRDDFASTQKHTSSQPRVAASMLGTASTNKGVLSKQMVNLCKAALNDVQTQFSGTKYNRIMLYLDWRQSGGEIYGGWSNAKCRGFRFFGVKQRI